MIHTTNRNSMIEIVQVETGLEQVHETQVTYAKFMPTQGPLAPRDTALLPRCCTPLGAGACSPLTLTSVMCVSVQNVLYGLTGSYE